MPGRWLLWVAHVVLGCWDSWVFVGYQIRGWVYVGSDMGLNFVVVRFVGEDVLDGVAVGLAIGCG